MATINLPPDFKELLRLLNDSDVRYLLVDGYAVAYHGYPRATADMDIWIEVDYGNAERLVAVLKKFGFDLPELSVELFLEKEKVIRMGATPVRIEILTSISGVTFQECFEKKITDELDGINVNLISLAHLKKNKKTSGRHKDLDDLENLP
jgi:hypothetical protein